MEMVSGAIVPVLVVVLEVDVDEDAAAPAPVVPTVEPQLARLRPSTTGPIRFAYLCAIKALRIPYPLKS
jgi:hypothetical protein